MKKYLIDVNLPSRFSLWSGIEFEHVININDEMKDSEIWEYAKTNSLTIISKDADFSEMMMINNPPPKVIHIKVGNMKINELHQFLHHIWADISIMSVTTHTVKTSNLFKIFLDGFSS